MAEKFVRQSQLLDQLVLDRATMDECGRIEVMWCYPKVHRVLGFICKSGRFDRTKWAFNLDQIDKVGENGVLVNSDPVETDRDRVQQLETLMGCEVWSDEGTKIGRISDYVFQLASGNIRYYLLSSNGLQGLTGKLYALYPNQILGYGRGRVMVSAGIVPGLELIQVGLDQKLEARFTGLEERLESKLKRTADRINERLNDEQLNQNLQENLQSGVKSWVDRARSVTAKVKDRAQEFLEDGLGGDSIRSRTGSNPNAEDSSDPEAVEFDFDSWGDADDQAPLQKSDNRSSDSSPNNAPNELKSQPWDEDSRNRSREQARNQLQERDRQFKREPDRSAYDSRLDTPEDNRSDDRTTDRPPLPNLSPKKPPIPQSSKNFTAQPRPLDVKPRSNPSRDRDAWDDDEWV